MRTVSHHLLTILCVAAFVLRGSLFMGGLVICTDPTGRSHLRWEGVHTACEIDESVDPGTPSQPPCHETQLKAEQLDSDKAPRYLTKLEQRRIEMPTISTLDVAPVAIHAASWRAPAVITPPDTRLSIRSVILIV